MLTESICGGWPLQAGNRLATFSYSVHGPRPEVAGTGRAISCLIFQAVKAFREPTEIP